MIKKRLLIIGVISIMLLSSITGCSRNNKPVDINGEVEDTGGETKEEETTEEKMPIYDYKNLPESNALSSEEFPSYYSRQLSERNKICYDEIYNASNSFQSELVLSKSISPETLKNIMNIIYLDTPELYMLETEYAYDTDINGNVYKVYLKYAFSQENYTKSNEAILQTLVSTISGLKGSETEYIAETSIISNLEGKFYNTDNIEVENFKGKNSSSSFYTIATTFQGSSLAFAKMMNYYCRKSGIDSAIVIGEITDTTYASELGLNLSEYKEPAEAIKETVDGSHVSVNIDYSSFYAWNIVKLNDEWYHVDILFPKKWKEKQKVLSDVEQEYTRTTTNVDDYTISQSRLFYMNEDMLGLTPECNSKNFQSLYRQGKYFVNYNENQIVIAVTNKLDEMIELKSNAMVYQFGSEETYDIFIKNFDTILKNYNENNSNVIQNYNLIENKETLSVLLCDMVYY